MIEGTRKSGSKRAARSLRVVGAHARIIVALCSLPLLVFGPGQALAAGKSQNADKLMQEQLRLQMKQAEERRKQAELAAKRAAQEAQRLQKEQEARARAAAKQAEALAKAQIKAQATAAAGKSQSAAATPRAAATKTAAETSEKSAADHDKTKTADTGPVAAASKTEIIEPPPATVEQLFKNLFAAKPQPAPQAHGQPIAQTSPAALLPATALATKSVAPTPNAVADRPATSVTTTSLSTAGTANNQPTRRLAPLTIPAFPQEVLAVNASPETLAAARALGFSPAPAAALLNLDVAVTRLTPPAGMNAADARHLLKQKIPQSQFALNQTYRIIRTAAESGDVRMPNGSATPARHGAPPCVQDRCFGREVISWRADLKRCATGLKIGIIDTAVDVTHPAFAHKNLQVRHLAQSGKPGPDWHGTGVTALLAGDKDSGTPGLLPDAAYYVADIFNAGQDNLPVSDTMSMLRAFDWLDSEHVRIINMSLAGPPDDLIRQAIEKLAAKGVLFVAAAGNEGPHAGPSYPAAYDSVIAVTAVNKDLQSYRNANRGAYVDVAAPGVAIWTALPGRKEGYHSGTSFATPYVTAAIATLYPLLQTKSAAAALRRLKFKDLGAPGPDPVYGQGLMVAPQSCGGATEMAGTSSPATPNGSERGFVTTTAPTTTRVARPAGAAEALPWLGLQSGD